MRLKLLVPLALLALVSLACGGGDDTEAGGGRQQGEAGESELSLSIQRPAEGAQVRVPFTLEYTSSVPLGAPETGRHHVHIWYDGNESEYEVVNGASFSVRDLSPGRHTITVSLRNADHSAAGAEDEVTVAVSGGEQTGEGAGENDTGYRY